MTSETWIYVGGFVAALLIFGGFLYYLTRVQARMGLAPDGPAPERAERPRSDRSGAAYTVAPASPPAIQQAPPVAPAELPPVAFDAVRHHLRTAIHVMLVGETHSGKSTTARAVLADRIEAGEDIVILDPHGDPENWAGIRATGSGRDFAAIDTMMAQLLGEMTRRYETRAGDARYTPPPMSIFVDEWPAIRTHCKQAGTFMTQLAQEGRKVGMRLVLLTQSDLVASLGIEGKGDVRGNFLMLLLGAKAIARCAESIAMVRPAALRRGEGTARAALTDGMQAMSETLDTSLARIWRVGSDHLQLPMKAPPVADAEPALDPLWQRFLNGEDLLEPETITGDSATGGAENGQKLVIEPVIETAALADTYQAKPVIEKLPDDETSKAIRLLVMGGMSRNKTIQLLSLPGVRADQLKRIRMAMGESEAAQ